MITHEISGGWKQARRASARPVDMPWGASRWRDIAVSSGFTAGQAADARAQDSWGASAPADTSVALDSSAAAAMDAGALAAPWTATRPCDVQLAGRWDRSIRPCDVRLLLIYNPKPAMRDSQTSIAVRRVDELGVRRDSVQALRASLYVPGSVLAFSFAGRPYFPSVSPDVFFNFSYAAPGQRVQPVDMTTGERWGSARQLDRSTRVPWGRARHLDGALTGITYPDYSGPVIVIDPAVEPDIKDTYMIANTVNLVVLPERTPLDAKSIRVALDTDSFSWSFSCEVLGRTSLNLIRPDVGGQKEIELEINGWRWVLVVERYSRSLKFPAEQYSVTGASRTQLLGAPYAPKRSAVNAAPITARQAAEDQLLYTGFTLQWDAINSNPVDWTLPAGAFSYQEQTAIEVIARIAEAVGGVVRPAAAADELSVLPRYRAPVWEWDAELVEKILPPDILTTLAGEWTPQPAWNSCYVSGTTLGVAVDVRRAGTAGDNPAPEVYDDLLTDTLANRSRGICELSKGGDIEIVSLSLPLFYAADIGSPGLVLPAMLCEVRADDAPWRGLCLSTEIVADGVGASNVQQTIRLERHTGVQ